MSRRLSWMLLMSLSAVLCNAAVAATIDPGLQQQMNRKADGEDVAVMMLLDRPADLSALQTALQTAGWQERRQVVIEALKAHAAGQQASTLAILADAAREGRAARVRSLWLANAIAFQGSRDVIESLAATETAATLIHDKRYDMISSVTELPHAIQVAAGDGDDIAPASPAQADTAWGVQWVNATRVWLDTGLTGEGVLVGHFDTGVWLTHPDIANRLWVNPGEISGNGIDDDGNGYVDDIHGYDFGDGDSNPNDDVIGFGSNHGTHTAGTVAGEGTNGTITGVAPGATILVCKVFPASGSGASFSAIYEGQQYAMEQGARVFTMSLGIGGDLPASLLRTERFTADAIRAGGVALFNSAGNDHFEYDPPFEMGARARVPAPWNSLPVPYSSLGGVIAVGGTGYQNLGLYNASSRGPVTWQDVTPYSDWPNPPGLIKPDVAAPGVGVNSLLKPNGYTGDSWSGTSMSCPHAAGVAALMLQKNPSLSPAGIDSLMELTAQDLGAAGKDNDYGSGLIDALAAVSAVPTVLLPHLVPTASTLDPAGDGVLDPGEAVDFVLELTNNSLVIDATGVTADLAVVPNPYVSVTSATASFGDIAQGGGAATNAGDVFRLSAAAGSPESVGFTVLVTVQTNEGYQRTFDLDLSVGLPDFLTHAVGAVALTVTDQGIIGYMSDAQIEGSGMGLPGGSSDLFVGSFWAGTSRSYICNRDFSGVSPNLEIFEWEVRDEPTGRVRNLGAATSDQDFESVFTDSGHPDPRDIVVTQRSRAWSAAPNDDFVILTYTIRNEGPTTVENYHVGLFCDWDIVVAENNEGATDPARNLTYMYAPGGPYYGIALLAPSLARNLTLISNPQYVYPESRIPDIAKMDHLAGTLSTPSTSGADDWSALTSAGPFAIPAGDVLQVTFAMVRGEDLADLEANTDAAQALLHPTAVAAEAPGRTVFLAQNHPNPFNPVTDIRFSLAHEGRARLAVYDLGGRRVRSLVEGQYPAGQRTVTWDGRSDGGAPLPSGIYLYRFETDGQVLSRKMMLVK